MELDLGVEAGSLLKRLRGMESFAIAPRQALEAVAALRVQQQIRWLNTARFKPLAPVSAKRKASKGRTTRPLLGGNLEKSLTTRRAKGSVRRINKVSVVVGTRNALAPLHQAGTRRGMPRRPVVAVTPQDRDELREVFITEFLRSGDSGRRTVRARL